MTPRLHGRTATSTARAGDEGDPSQASAADVRWLRPATAPARVVDSGAVTRRLEAIGPCDPAAWRATQLVALLVGADLDGGQGGAAEQWDRGTRIRALDLAARGGMTVGDADEAIRALWAAGVLWADHAGEPGPLPDDVAALLVRVVDDCVTDGAAAAIAWPVVTAALAGSAAGLLVARALAELVDRPGHPTVVPYGALAAPTRYSEGMVKRGVAAVLDAGVVVQHPCRGRAPAYAFTDWALGRVAGPPPSPHSHPQPAAGAGRGLPPAVASPAVALMGGRAGVPTPAAPAPIDHSGLLRARIAGVEVEVPAATGAEVVVETVVDGRAVTARLIIPAARP